MNKINWKLRWNPQIVVPFILFLVSTVFATAHVDGASLTSWHSLGNVLWSVLTNPAQLFAIAFAVYGHIVDPTTTGITDSSQAQRYSKPRKDVK